MSSVNPDRILKELADLWVTTAKPTPEESGEDESDHDDHESEAQPVIDSAADRQQYDVEYSEVRAEQVIRRQDDAEPEQTKPGTGPIEEEDRRYQNVK